MQKWYLKLDKNYKKNSNQLQISPLRRWNLLNIYIELIIY